MKKLFVAAVVGVTVAMIAACGGGSTTEITQSETKADGKESAESVEKQEETEEIKETKQDTKKQTMTVSEFENLLSELPVTVDSVEYVVQSDEYKSLYPDALNAIITNHTSEDIKNAVVAFVAWDENNLPVKIEGQFDFNGGAYVKEVTYDDINLVPDASFGENYGYSLGESCKISSFKAIVESFETFNGESWENPYYSAWRKLYEGNKYSDELTTEVKISDKAEFVSGGSSSSANEGANEEEILAAIEEQPFKVISTDYIVQSDEYKSIYPDMLQAVLENNTELDIKSAVVAFVAWDKNGLPVKIEGQFDFNGGAYIQKANYDSINMVPGSTFGQDKGYSLSDNCEISSFKAIVVSYEAYDGTTWSNPEYNNWKKLYEGVKQSN